MRRLMPRFWDFDARPWLGGIRTPALVLCGGQDPLLPVRHARAVHEAVAGSTFVEIEGAGHVPVSERRPEVSEAFRQFVRRLDG
jgi:pimeloyl-ACP methyl ester carboxylesterase